MDRYHLPAFCPTCGQPNPVKQSPEWLMNRFSGIFSNILACLIHARKDRRAVGMRELVMAAYADDPDGGPVNAPNSIAVTVHRNRPKLQKLGWDIVGPAKTGAGYQLIELER